MGKSMGLGSVPFLKFLNLILSDLELEPRQRHDVMCVEFAMLQGEKETMKMNIFERVYAHMGNEVGSKNLMNTHLLGVLLLWRKSHAGLLRELLNQYITTRGEVSFEYQTCRLQDLRFFRGWFLCYMPLFQESLKL